MTAAELLRRIEDAGASADDLYIGDVEYVDDGYGGEDERIRLYRVGEILFDEEEGRVVLRIGPDTGISVEEDFESGEGLRTVDYPVCQTDGCRRPARRYGGKYCCGPCRNTKGAGHSGTCER